MCENFGAMVTTYLAGVFHDKYIYMKSGFYAVSLLLGACSSIGVIIAFYYKVVKDQQFAKEDQYFKEKAKQKVKPEPSTDLADLMGPDEIAENAKAVSDEIQEELAFGGGAVPGMKRGGLPSKP